MSTPTKIGVALLAIFGAVVIYGLLVHILHFLVIAALVLGVLYVGARLLGVRALGGGGRRSLP